MAIVGYATMQIIPSVKGFEKTVGRQLNQQSESAGRSAGKSMSKGLLGSFTGLAARITGAIAIGTVVKKGFDFASNAVIGFNSTLQQANIGFTTMLGNGQKASTFLNQLVAFANKTPFDASDLITYSQRLLATGVAAKNIVPYMTAIGDAAAAMGTGAEGVDAISRAIGQMASKGKVQSDELLQLTEAGIPALQILANEYHVTTGRMQEMITAGKVASADAIPKLIAGLEHGTKSTAAFGGMMASQSKTFSGALANIKDSATTAIAGVTLPLFNKLSSAAQRVSTAIGGSTFQQAMNSFSDKFSKGLNSAVSALSEVDWAGIGKNVGYVGKVIGTTFGPLVVDAAKKFLAALKPTSDALAAMFKVVDQHKTTFQALAIGFASFLILNKVNGFVVPVTNVFKSIKAGVPVMKALNKEWAIFDLLADANLFVLIAAGVVALGVALIYAYKHSKAFRDIVDGIGRWFAGPFLTPFKAVAAWFTGPFVNFFKSAGSAIASAWTGTLNWFQQLPGRVLGFLQALPGKLLAWGKTLALTLAYDFGYAVGLAVAEIIALPGQVLSIMTKTGDWMLSAAKTALTATAEFFAALPGRVLAGLKALPGIAQSALVTAGSWMRNAASSAVSGTVGFFRSAPVQAGQALAALPGKVKGAVADAGSWLYDAGKQVVSGLVHGIEDATGGALGAIKALGKSMIKGFKDAIDSHSPSREFRKVGRFIPAGLALGINDGAGHVLKAVSNMVSLPAAVAATRATGGSAPLVGSLTVASTGNVRDDLNEVNFQLRRIQRGGVYVGR